MYNRHEDFESVFPQPGNGMRMTICDGCINVRASLNGSSDPWPMEELIKARDMLKRRLDNWQEPSSLFDLAVKIMVLETINLANDEIKTRGW